MSVLKRTERLGRRRARGLLRALLNGGYDRADLQTQPNRILVVRTDSRLGNLVLMKPLLDSLAERFPNAETTILASHVFAGLLEGQGHRIIRVDKKGQIRRPWEFFELVDKLRSAEYDAVLDASHPHSFSLSTAVTAMLTHSPRRIGFDSGGGGDWYTRTVPEPPLNIHESKAIHTLGNAWPDWPAWSPPVLKHGNTQKRDALGIHVGASGRKSFPLEYFAKIIDEVARHIAIEVYWGTQVELEKAEALRSDHHVRVMPCMNTSELSVSLAGLRAFLTPDNGPMHVASALGVPVTALFRIDNTDRFRPLSKDSEILLDPEASHPEKAVEMIRRLLSRSNH